MGMRTDRIVFFVLASVTALGIARGQENVRAELERQFARSVRPFLQTYCVNCHGQQQPAAQMDLSGFTTMTGLMHDGRRWSQILERLEAGEMPPKGARHPRVLRVNAPFSLGERSYVYRSHISSTADSPAGLVS
jgi:hypothetical protein